MEPRQSLHHGQPETCAVIAAIVRVVRLNERLAELGQIRLRDTDAVIGDAELDIPVDAPGRDAHPTAGVGELDGV